MNKGESAVIDSFDFGASALLSDEQKVILKEKLSNRINTEGILQLRSQVHRTQLANKEEAIEKINELVTRALHRKKARIATRVSKATKEKRLESKKRKSEVKEGRKKFRY